MSGSSGHDYFISSFDDTTGKVTIANDGSDGSLKPRTAYMLRITFTSTGSKSAKKTASDEFMITL